MHFLKPFAFILLCAAAVAVMNSCKKNNDAAGSTTTGLDSNGTVAITPVGTPVGIATSKTIGPGGGTLSSPDGNLVLTIPAGALASNTKISVQPITSQMPGSAGLAYDLEPNGTKFAVPVTIAFHYTAGMLPDNNPEFSFIAYQDSTGAWKADATNRDFDTTAKTVSLDVSHFTNFELGYFLFVTADKLELHASEKSNLLMMQSFVDMDKVAVVKETMEISGSQVSSWQVNDVVNGNPTLGTITKAAGFAERAVYQAPAAIPVAQTVFVKCVTKIHLITYKKGKVFEDNPHVTKGVILTLLPDEKLNFTVRYTVLDSNFSQLYGIIKSPPVYSDTLIFDVSVNGGAVTVGAPHNTPPNVVPPHAETPLQIFDWVPDPVGEINVKKIETDASMTTDALIRFNMIHENAETPGFLLRSKIGMNVQTINSQPFGGTLGFPEVLDIDIKRQMPYWYYITGGVGIYEKLEVLNKP